MHIGIIQNQPIFGAVEANLQDLESRIRLVNADFIVLPELCTTGYQFVNREEALELGESIPDGPSAQRLMQLAHEKKAWLIAGLAERDGDTAYNSALICGPEGYLGTYRKAHLFDSENDCFSPGNTPFPVFDLPGARVGVMICFDWRFPESMRTMALKGADLVAHPSNLVLPHCPEAMITRCLENRMFAVTADRVGSEERIPGQPLKFIGQSQIVDPDGTVLARASRDLPETIEFEIDPKQARQKSINTRNDLLSNRRTDLYELD
ncbi:MAG: acyltransferase [Candidatus Nitrohelix vancouverensis]|uniref:Acyltransferase n=1 Tax=Candidatus Nitrohelix vancouverensis TaxID=2705534 RepID=A0A7T0C102_9BACT|nr:MAG: acyltransferase [Candidatus Nitrohelix vancouverensis]